VDITHTFNSNSCRWWWNCFIGKLATHFIGSWKCLFFQHN